MDTTTNQGGPRYLHGEARGLETLGPLKFSSVYATAGLKQQHDLLVRPGRTVTSHACGPMLTACNAHSLG